MSDDLYRLCLNLFSTLETTHMRFHRPWTSAEKRFLFASNYVLKEEAIGESINLKLINSKTYKFLAPFLTIAFIASYLLSFVFTFPNQVWLKVRPN